MSEKVIKKVQCPLCYEEGFDTAGDNAHVFESGFANCVARHGSIGKLENVKKESNNSQRSKPLNNKKKWQEDGEYADIKTRKLSRKTCQTYGYMVNYDKKIHIANYYDSAGNVVMQQLRDAKKNFPLKGDKEYKKELWGKHLFTPNENVFVTITEGQIDALSVAEVFNCKYPVVSLPNGAQAAKDVLLKHKDWLEGFKYIVLAFDNDKDGIKATEECMKIIEPGKVRIARFKDVKDANDLLKQGRKKDLIDIIYNAAKYIPDPIITDNKLLESLRGYKFRTVKWPFKNAKNIQPIRIPSVYSIAARPGIGKTEFIGEIIRYFISNSQRIGIISLEQTKQQVLTKLTDNLIGTKLCNISDRELTDEEIESCRMVAENIAMYDHITYGSSLESIVEHIPHMVRTLGCELIIFDNLSYSATGLDGDERRGIDKAMISLKDSTVKYDYTLFNVCHVKRDEEYIEEGEFPVSVSQIRGSQGIEMYSDYIIGLHRDKNDENLTVRNTLQACVLKDRMRGEDDGKVFTMKYDTKTRRLT